MSDFICKIIPANPKDDFTENQFDKLVTYLNSKKMAEKIELNQYEQVKFIDCGGNLERISCPCCNQELEFDWWGKMMELASEKEFEDLRVSVPCCNEQVSLNDLNYYFLCGFAKIEIVIYNPQIVPNVKLIEEMKELVGVKVKIIECHY